MENLQAFRFPLLELNEKRALKITKANNAAEKERNKQDEIIQESVGFYYRYQKVSYITDIHLDHRIINANCHSDTDVINVIRKIVKTISSTDNILLIGGDITCDFSLFKLFVETLSQQIPSKATVVFVLGNHEVWPFAGKNTDEIAEIYRSFLSEYGMYLLHNEVFYLDQDKDSQHFGNTKRTHIIRNYELQTMSDEEIAEKLRRANLVILGGTGFSGKNEEFNADNGIYRYTIDREHEIDESSKFNDLYLRLLPILQKRGNSIVFTHMPKNDWGSSSEYDRGIFYINGHTHINYFHDDGDYHIYSDNQIGYLNKRPRLKYLYVSTEYDIFSTFSNGIYEITSDQYRDFFRGKNIMMDFERKIHKLYMVKKADYYCFFHQAASGSLSILNGGSMKRLYIDDIKYYYDNMLCVIDRIEEPFKKYRDFQEKIADKIRSIGGCGTIHGCIIDIDFWNHIYVNPIDLTVVGYWAENIVNKICFPTIPELLKENCPSIYNRWLLQERDNSQKSDSLIFQNSIFTKPIQYLDTSIYQASREICKMQKLRNHILTLWIDDIHSESDEKMILECDYNQLL